MWVWHYRAIVVMWLSLFCVSSSRFREWYGRHFQVIAVVWLYLFCVPSPLVRGWYVSVALPGLCSCVTVSVMCLIFAVPWVIFECGASRLVQSCDSVCSVSQPRWFVSDMWVWHFQVMVVVWLSVFCVSSSRFRKWYVSVALPGNCSRVAVCVLCLILAVPWVICECGTSRLL